MRLAGKTALITGAARGIGLAFAEAYLREGARVVLADISGAEVAAQALGDHALGLTMNVTDQASINRAVTAAADWGHGIDILLNNAAIFDLAPIIDITRDSYDRVFAVNVAGTLFPLQAVARRMITQNSQTPGRGGKIINMASQAGRRGEALVAVYCASKAAIISLTQSAGLDLIKHGINVNAIAPGYMATDNTAQLRADPVRNKTILDRIPAARWGEPSDLAGAVVYLASPASDYLHGHILAVDGGWLAR